MHRIEVSEGIVLGKHAIGEAHTLVAVLTPTQGLLRAKATSTRAESSKLRYGLEPMTQGRFSFVQGRYEWKLTGVEAAGRLLSQRSDARAAAGRVSKLLMRLIRGSEEGSALFKTVEEGLTQLAQADSADAVSGIECVLVLRILAHLGYLPHAPALTPYVEGDFSSAKQAVSATQSRAFLIRTINESLMQTGL